MLLLCVAGCSQILGIEQLEGPPEDASSEGSPGGDTPGVKGECTAQRAVHIIAGNGGLAWFTLAWPAPQVVKAFQPIFAYDDPALVQDLTVDPAHPLFVRRVGGKAIWVGTGQAPQPSVFVAGQNETHTNQPASIVRGAGNELVASGAVIQASLQPTIPVLAFGVGQPYGPAPGAPSPILVNDVDGAINELRATGMVPASVESQLRPSSAQLASYVAPGSSPVVVNLATELAFTANAFRFGLIGTVLLPSFNDDPHGAFDTSIATQRANDLATMLDAFYRDLAANDESCTKDGNPLALADNVVLIVTGDTPKNSFQRMGWPDGTPGAANWMYVRSNGFTRPGWFGSVNQQTRQSFDPNTGDINATSSVAGSTGAAVGGTLFAIARGDLTAVRRFTNAPFGGVIVP